MSIGLDRATSARTILAIFAVAWSVGFWLPAIAQAPTPAQKRLFASIGQELIDKLQASGKFASIKQAEPLTLVARTLEGSEVSIDLANIAASVTARPKERQLLVDGFLATVLASVEKPPVELGKDAFIASLRVIVRHAAYVQVPANAKAASAAIWKPLAGDAIAIAAMANGERITVAMAGDGAKHGLSDDALFEAALEQTQRYSQDHITEDAGRVRVLLAADESYSPSLLLLKDIWSKVERDFGSNFLVAIPDRTVLLAAPANNAVGLKRTVDVLTHQRRISAHIPHFIQRVGDGWTPVPSR